MGYVIVAGIGLAVGLGLMIWALRERALRYGAEEAAAKATTQLAAQRTLTESNAAKALELEEEATRLNDLCASQARVLEEMRSRLAQCGDPEAVRSWLEDELKGGVL